MKKNTMKKVIVPAMGLLLLSAAASTTGTVAWFVANRSATATINNIVAINPEKSLAYVSTAGVNTSVGTFTDKLNTTDTTNTCNNPVTITKQLRDASANYAGTGTTATMYKGIITENATSHEPEVVSYAALAADGSDAAYNASSSIFYYASWTMTFQMKDKSADDNANSLFFNATSSLTITSGDTIGTGDKDIAKAFRILMIGSEGNYVVWAPNAGSTTDTHVTGTTGTSTWATSNVVNTNASATKVVPSETTAAAGKVAANHYLGEIASNSTLAVTCYAYFEGCDDDCVAAAKNIGKTLTSTLNFYSVDASQWKVAA